MCACLLTRLRPRILPDQRSTAAILVSPPAVLVYVPDTNLLSTIAYGLMPYRYKCSFLRAISLSRTITVLRTGSLRDNSYNNTNSLDNNYRYRRRPSTSIKAKDAQCSFETHRSRCVYATYQLHSKRLVVFSHNSGAFHLVSHPFLSNRGPRRKDDVFLRTAQGVLILDLIFLRVIRFVSLPVSLAQKGGRWDGSTL